MFRYVATKLDLPNEFISQVDDLFALRINELFKSPAALHELLQQQMRESVAKFNSHSAENIYVETPSLAQAELSARMAVPGMQSGFNSKIIDALRDDKISTFHALSALLLIDEANFKKHFIEKFFNLEIDAGNIDKFCNILNELEDKLYLFHASQIAVRTYEMSDVQFSALHESTKKVHDAFNKKETSRVLSDVSDSSYVGALFGAVMYLPYIGGKAIKNGVRNGKHSSIVNDVRGGNKSIPAAILDMLGSGESDGPHSFRVQLIRFIGGEDEEPLLRRNLPCKYIQSRCCYLDLLHGDQAAFTKKLVEDVVLEIKLTEKSQWSSPASVRK